MTPCDLLLLEHRTRSSIEHCFLFPQSVRSQSVRSLLVALHKELTLASLCFSRRRTWCRASWRSASASSRRRVCRPRESTASRATARTWTCSPRGSRKVSTAAGTRARAHTHTHTHTHTKTRHSVTDRFKEGQCSRRRNGTTRSVQDVSAHLGTGQSQMYCCHGCSIQSVSFGFQSFSLLHTYFIPTHAHNPQMCPSQAQDTLMTARIPHHTHAHHPSLPNRGRCSRHRVARHPGERRRHGAQGILRGPRRASHPARAHRRPGGGHLRAGPRRPATRDPRRAAPHPAVQLGRAPVPHNTLSQVGALGGGDGRA